MLYILTTLFRPLLGHHQADIRTLKGSYKFSLFMPDGIPSTLCNVSDILRGNEAELGGNEQELSAKDLGLFKYSPVTSCDIERIFSSYEVLPV
jgi:hypothetical protein